MACYPGQLGRTNGSILQVQSADGRKTAAVLPIGVHKDSSSDKGRLVFNRYGNQYFLSKVFWPEYDTGRELRKSVHESELARKGGKSACHCFAAQSVTRTSDSYRWQPE